MGKSIEEFGKTGKLTYFETFVNSLCSELPLTESSPSIYVRVPKFVTLLPRNQLGDINIKENSLFIIDSLSFLEHDPAVCYKIYEAAVSKNCRIIIGGCSSTGSPSQILNRSSDLWIRLENDVGGHGKFKISSDSSETSVLWKWGQGKFEISKYMKVWEIVGKDERKGMWLWLFIIITHMMILDPERKKKLVVFINNAFMVYDFVLALVCLLFTFVLVTDQCASLSSLIYFVFFTSQSFQHYLIWKFPMIDINKHHVAYRRIVIGLGVVDGAYMFMCVTFWQKTQVHPVYCAVCL